jgi:hypothetical protein
MFIALIIGQVCCAKYVIFGKYLGKKVPSTLTYLIYFQVCCVEVPFRQEVLGKKSAKYIYSTLSTKSAKYQVPIFMGHTFKYVTRYLERYFKNPIFGMCDADSYSLPSPQGVFGNLSHMNMIPLILFM